MPIEMDPITIPMAPSDPDADPGYAPSEERWPGWPAAPPEGIDDPLPQPKTYEDVRREEEAMHAAQRNLARIGREGVGGGMRRANDGTLYEREQRAAAAAEGEPMRIEERVTDSPGPQDAYQGAAQAAGQPGPPAPRGGGGGYRPQPVQAQSLIQMDAEVAAVTAKAGQDLAAIKRRIMDSPDVPDAPDSKGWGNKEKLAAIADAQRQHDKMVADVRQRRDAFRHADMEGIQQRGHQLAAQRDVHAMTGEAAQRKIGEESFDARADMHMGQRERIAKANSHYQRQRQEIASEVRKSQEAYSVAMKDFAKSAGKTGSPLSTGQSVLGGIGVVLAGIAAGLGNKDATQVVGLVERMVDRELANQQKRTKAKLDFAGGKLNIVKFMQQRFPEADEAYAAARAATMEKFAHELDAEAGSTMAKRGGAKFQESMQMIKDRAAQYRNDMDGLVESNRLVKQGARNAAAWQAGKTKRDAAKREAMGGYVPVGRGKKGRGEVGRIIWGKGGEGIGFAAEGVSDKRIEEFSHASALRRTESEQIAMATQMAREGVASMPPGSAKRAHFQQLIGTVAMPYMKEMTGAGVTEEDRKSYGQIATGSTGSMVDEVLNRAANGLMVFDEYRQRGHDAVGDSIGFVPAHIRRVPGEEPGSVELVKKYGQRQQQGAQLKDGP